MGFRFIVPVVGQYHVIGKTVHVSTTMTGQQFRGLCTDYGLISRKKVG